ncbi:MAG: MarR family transcriptional regulator [Sulfitobacter sp.]
MTDQSESDTSAMLIKALVVLNLKSKQKANTLASNKKKGPEAGNTFEGYDIHDTLSHLLRRSHFHAESLFSRELGAYGVTSRQLALLVAISQNAGASQRVLGDIIALDMNTVSDLLRRMEKNGLIERRPSEVDARSTEIYLAAKGISILSDIPIDNRRYQDTLAKNLSAEEAPVLKALLRKLLDL